MDDATRTKDPRERQRFLVTIRLVDGKPVGEPGSTPTVPEVGDVLSEEGGKVWVVTSANRKSDQLLLTVDVQDAPAKGAARA